MGLSCRTLLPLFRCLMNSAMPPTELELGNARRFFALIGQRDLQALVQERQLAQTRGQGVEVELGRVHDGRVGLEGDLGAGLACPALPVFASGALGMPLAYSCSQVDDAVSPFADARFRAAAIPRAHSRSSRPRRAARRKLCRNSNRTCRRRAAWSSPPARRTRLLLRACPPECRGRCRPRSPNRLRGW